MTDRLVSDLAAIADAIDFPPIRWRLWPRRVPVRINTISAVMRAMDGSTEGIDRLTWARIWVSSRASSVRARTTLENDIRLVECQFNLPSPADAPWPSWQDRANDA